MGFGLLGLFFIAFFLFYAAGGIYLLLKKWNILSERKVDRFYNDKRFWWVYLISILFVLFLDLILKLISLI
jgi:hypothetical protein